MAAVNPVILIEYSGKGRHQGNVLHVFRDQITSVNGQEDTTTIAPGDTVIDRSSNSRSGRSCPWKGTVVECDADDSTQDDKKTKPSDPPITKGKAKQLKTVNVLKCVSAEKSSPVPCPAIVAELSPESSHDHSQVRQDDTRTRKNDASVEPDRGDSGTSISELKTVTILNQHLMKFADKMTKNFEGYITNTLVSMHQELKTLDEKVELLSNQLPAAVTTHPQSLVLNPLYNQESLTHETPLTAMSGDDVESVLSSLFNPSAGGESCGGNSFGSSSHHLPLPPMPYDCISSVPGMVTPSGNFTMAAVPDPTLLRPTIDAAGSNSDSLTATVLHDIFSPGTSSTSGSTKSRESAATTNSAREKKRVENWVRTGFSDHLTVEQIIVKNNFQTPTANWTGWYKLGLQLAKHNIFGERTLSLSSFGVRDLRLLDPTKVSFLKNLLRKYAPHNCQSGAEYEKIWSDLRGKISQMCKRLRQLLDRYSLKDKAEQLEQSF